MDLEGELHDTDPTNPGLYFGPYRIAQLTPGSLVVLERNPTWWGKPPAFTRVVLSLVENTAAMEADLLAGSIDMISGELGALSVDQALAVRDKLLARFPQHLPPDFRARDDVKLLALGLARGPATWPKLKPLFNEWADPWWPQPIDQAERAEIAPFVPGIAAE